MRGGSRYWVLDKPHFNLVMISWAGRLISKTSSQQLYIQKLHKGKFINDVKQEGGKGWKTFSGDFYKGCFYFCSINAHPCKIRISPVPNRTYLNILTWWSHLKKMIDSFNYILLLLVKCFDMAHLRTYDAYFGNNAFDRWVFDVL